MRETLLVLMSPAAVIVAFAEAPVRAIPNGDLDGQGQPSVWLMVAQDATGAPLWRCTGTLLSPTVFLTAGHCAESLAAHVEIWFDADVESGIPANGYPFTGQVGGTPHTHPDTTPAPSLSAMWAPAVRSGWIAPGRSTGSVGSWSRSWGHGRTPHHPDRRPRDRVRSAARRRSESALRLLPHGERGRRDRRDDTGHRPDGRRHRRRRPLHLDERPRRRRRLRRHSRVRRRRLQPVRLRSRHLRLGRDPRAAEPQRLRHRRRR